MADQEKENSDSNFFVGIAIALGGISVFGYQAHQYLKTGIWPPISLITAMQYMKIEWAIYPADWIGLYKVLDFLPLSATAFVFGLITTINR